MADGTLCEIPPNLWRGTLNGWTVQIDHDCRGWTLAIMHTQPGYTYRCQPARSLHHGAKLARQLIEAWGPAKTK